MGLIATVAAAATLLFGPSVASGASNEVASRKAALDRAATARVEAERRVHDATARLAAVQARLTDLGAADAELTQQIADARKDLREYAVAAYIDGGQTEIFISSLAPEKAVALSWQSNMALGQSVSAEDAASRFDRLQEANRPALLEAAAELDRVNAQLDEARHDAIQAAAHERDAEAALARAREAAEQARRARAAEESARRSAANQSSQGVAGSSGSVSTSGAGSAGTSSTSAARGNPTSAESATLARIRRCESGGNYSARSSSGRYRGAYQFDRATWAGVGGSGDPAAATAAEQDYRALLLLRQRGTRPWPVCGR